MTFNLKFLIIIFIQLIFSQKSYSGNFYNFNYLLCDSLENANYNFGIKNSKKNLLIYKLKGLSFKKTKIKKDTNNFIINLDESSHFRKPIYLNLIDNHFYLSGNDMFLGGCFVVKNEGILKCKLQSYHNVFNDKLPLACN